MASKPAAGSGPVAAEEPAEAPRASNLRRLAANRLAAVSGIVVLLAYAAVIFGPSLWRLAPEATDPLHALAAPSAAHLLGTDELGRDELSRLLFGGRVTLAIGLAAMATSVIAGVVVGAAAAFYGGWTSVILMRLTDAMLAIPGFFLAIVAVTVFGSGPIVLILIIGCTSWMPVARIVYGETLHWKNLDFVLAAESTGATARRELTRHILPQVVPSVIVSASLGIGWAILTATALSYLGLGVQPPTPDWGNMLQNALQYVWTSPLLAIYPGVAITIVVLAFNFFGDGLRDALDPRLRI
jgi:peptide/nickel transport system permease protein